jgi:hypothetical protein
MPTVLQLAWTVTVTSITGSAVLMSAGSNVMSKFPGSGRRRQ